jgi:hypothetical protein
MKSGLHDPLQALKKSDNQLNPVVAPVTAGAPNLIPNFFSGSTSLIHVDAAREAGTALPPVLEVPSGSLNVSIYEIFAPPETKDLTVSEKVVSEELVGAENSIGTNCSPLLARSEDGEAA